MPLYVRNQDTSEEIKSTNWGDDVCALALSHTHTNFCLQNGSSEGCGRGPAREGWKERRPRAPEQPGCSCPLALLAWGAGSSCRVGWDGRLNIPPPMHTDNAHSCPACFAFIRPNCSRSGGRRAGGGDVPIHTLGIGGLPAAGQKPPPAWSGIPAPEFPLPPSVFLPTHCSGRSGDLREGKGSRSWVN